MTTDAALRKIFAQLDHITSRLDALDTRPKLADLQHDMRQVSANSRLVVAAVQAHGGIIDRLEKTIEQLHCKCPLLRQEHESTVERAERVSDLALIALSGKTGNE